MLIFPAGAFAFFCQLVESNRREQTNSCDERRKVDTSSARHCWSSPGAPQRDGLLSPRHIFHNKTFSKTQYSRTHAHISKSLLRTHAHSCDVTSGGPALRETPHVPSPEALLTRQKKDQTVLLGGRWCVGRRPRCSNLKAQLRLAVQKRPKKNKPSTAAIKSNWDMRPIKTAKWCSEAANGRLQSHAALSFFKVIQQDLIWLSTQRTKVRA